MFVVISYDIVSDRRRTKVANTLEDHGRRVQYSVFEVNLKEPRFRKLRRQLEKLIDHETDSIRYYHLCRACYERIEVMGTGQPVEKEEVVYIV